jgi:hypothetical protein
VNYSGETIVVLGYEREPYLRFTRHAVYENLRSPATYLSRVREPAKARVPASADPKAPPRWRQVAARQSFEWHDHRIHWTAPSPPPAVQSAPREVHLIFHWSVPARADGKPFRITGFLGYVPEPGRAGGGETSRWLLAAGAGGAALAAVVIAAGVRRAKRRTP